LRIIHFNAGFMVRSAAAQDSGGSQS